MAAASQIGARFDCLDNLDLQSLGDFVAFWGGAEEESHTQAVDSSSSSPTGSSYERPSDDSGAHEPMAPSTAKRSQKKPPKFSSTHRRQQHMKRILHEHAREYEAKLRELEQARVVRAESLIIHGDTPREDQLVLLEKWKAIAKDQSEQLARARYENNKLWLRVVEEKKLARRLHQMLIERASSNAVSFVAGALAYHSSSRDMYQIGSAMLVNRTGTADLSMSDRSVFTELVSSLGGMISSTRPKFDVLEHSAPRSGSYRSWWLCVDANQRSVVEVVDCEELPYRKEQVDAALQRLTGSSAAGCRELSAEVVTIRWSGLFACLLQVAESHDIPWVCTQHFGGSVGVVVEEEFARTSDGLDGFRYRRASRTFVDDARTVVFSSGRIERVDERGDPVPGFACEIQVWILRTQTKHACELSGDPRYSAVTQRLFMIAPIAERGSSTPPNWSQDELHTRLLPLLNREISSRLQRFENALVSDGAAK